MGTKWASFHVITGASELAPLHDMGLKQAAK